MGNIADKYLAQAGIPTTFKEASHGVDLHKQQPTVGGSLLLSSKEKEEESKQPVWAKYADPNQLAAPTPVQDKSKSAAFAKGFTQSQSIYQKAARVAAAKNPESVQVIRMFDEDGNYSPSTGGLETEYGEDFNSLDYEARIARMQEVDNKRFYEKYGHVTGSRGTELLGELTGAVVADPVLAAIPMGGSAKAAAIIGGAIGATDAAAQSAMETGKVSAYDVMVGTTVGAATGGILYKVGSKVTDYITDRAKKRLPANEDDLNKIINESGIEKSSIEGVPQSISEINANLDLKNPKADWYKNLFESNPSPESQPKPAMAGAKQEVGPTKEWTGDVPKMTPEETIDAIDEGLRYHAKDLSDFEIDEVMKLRARMERAAGKVVPHKLGDDTVINGWSQREMDDLEIGAGKKTMDESDYANNVVARNKDGQPDVQATKDVGLDLTGAKNITSGVHRAMREEKVRANTKMGEELGGQAPKPITSSADILGPEQARKAMNVGTRARLFSRPQELVRKMGTAGKELVRRLHTMRADADRAFYELSTKIDAMDKDLKAVIKDRAFTPEIQAQVNLGLNNPSKIKSLAPEAQKIVNNYRAFYSKVLDDAYANGMYDEATYKALKKTAAEQGYSPRIWDMEYLASAEGQQSFQKLLTEKGVNAKAAKGLLKAAGYKKAQIEGLIRPSADGKVKFAADAAKEIWLKRQGFVQRTKGNNLENARSLKNLDYDDLKEFLITDPKQVLVRYAQESYDAIYNVKYFGKKGEVAEKLSGNILMNYGDGAKKYADEMFFTETRNRQSKVIQAQRDQSEFGRSVSQVATSLQVLKLGFAQIMNATQSVANGTVRMAQQRGFAPAAYQSLKSISNILFGGPEAREWARSTGAAAHNAMLHIIAEGGDRPLLFADKFLQYTGFSKIEEFNRLFAADMGKNHIQYVAREVAKRQKLKAQGKLSREGEKTLEIDRNSLWEMGLDPDNAAGWNVDEIKRAAALFSDQVNFRPGAMSIPQAFQSPAAKIVRQFQSFIYFQTNFVMDSVKKSYQRDGVKGVLNTLTAIGAVAAPVGLGATYTREGVKSMLTGDDKRLKELNDMGYVRRIVEGALTVGMGGMVVDAVIQGHSSGWDRAVLGFAGPTIGDAIGLAKGASGSIKQGSVEPILKQIVSMGPYGHTFIKATERKPSVGLVGSTSNKGMMSGL